MSDLNDLARELLDRPNFAAIATLPPDGSPQVSVAWVDREIEPERVGGS